MCHSLGSSRWHCSRIPEYHSTFMRAWSFRVFALLLVSVLAPACRQKADTAPPIVTPSITLERTDASVGSPVEMTYRFVVAPNATVGDDYWVFVHFLDTD